MHVIACTGFHKLMYYADLHWIYRYDEDAISDLLIAEIEEGMDKYSYAGPVVQRLTAKAGIIKIATDYQRIADVTKKLMRAAAAAQAATKAPISTHTEHGTYALEQIRFLTDLGVPPQSIIIYHWIGTLIWAITGRWFPQGSTSSMTISAGSSTGPTVSPPS